MSGLEAPALAWLQEEENPSVRYLTLRGLLGRDDGEAETAAAKAAIMTAGPVPKILSRQKEGGCWESLPDFYARTKYRGTVWTFLLLAELQADGGDPRIGRAGRLLLDRSQEPDGGGFAYRQRPGGPGGEPAAVLPCLTGNLLFALLRLGMDRDPQVAPAVHRAAGWITRTLRFDDGEGPPPRGPAYEARRNCWGAHTCTLAVVKSLKGLAEIPEAGRSPEVRRTIERCVEFLLRHRLVRRSRDPGRVACERWLRLGFPLMWDTDYLELLLLLTAEGVRDPRMEQAVRLLRSRAAGGRWPLDRGFAGRMQVRLEREGSPSRWITLRALTALRRWDGRP